MQQYEKLPSEAANRQQKGRNKRGYVMAKATSQRIGRYDVSVTKKRIKNLYLRVSPQGGSISVNAPLRVSNEEIIRFVLSREDWIEQQLSKQASHATVTYSEGDELPYFGKKLTLRLRYRVGRAKAERKGDTLELTIRQDADILTRKKTIDAWYRAELYEMAGAMLPAAERTVGKRAGEIKVRDMKSRWGTCNVVKARVWLNLQLAKYKPEALEYVMIHELTHLWEYNHGPAFKARMDQYCPNWRQRKKELNAAADFE